MTQVPGKRAKKATKVVPVQVEPKMEQPSALGMLLANVLERKLFEQPPVATRLSDVVLPPGTTVPEARRTVTDPAKVRFVMPTAVPKDRDGNLLPHSGAPGPVGSMEMRPRRGSQHGKN